MPLSGQSETVSNDCDAEIVNLWRVRVRHFSQVADVHIVPLNAVASFARWSVVHHYTIRLQPAIPVKHYRLHSRADLSDQVGVNPVVGAYAAGKNSVKVPAVGARLRLTLGSTQKQGWHWYVSPKWPDCDYKRCRSVTHMGT